MRIGRLRIELKRAAVARCRFVELSLVPQGSGEVDMRINEARLRFQSPPEAVDCLVHLSAIAKKEAKAVLRFGIFRILLQCESKPAGCLFRVALGTERSTHVEIGAVQPRVQLQRAAMAGDRFVPFSLLLKNAAQ